LALRRAWKASLEDKPGGQAWKASLEDKPGRRAWNTMLDWGAFDSAKNHKRQRRKRQSVTAKREKSQT